METAAVNNTNAFLIVYAILAFSTVIIFSLINLQGLDLYAATFAIEFLAIFELVPPPTTPGSHGGTIMRVLMLSLFVVVIAQRIIHGLT
jgi:hypothetical protein